MESCKIVFPKMDTSMYPSYVALSDFFVIYLQNPVESPTVRHVKTIENIEVALPERFKPAKAETTATWLGYLWIC